MGKSGGIVYISNSTWSTSFYLVRAAVHAPVVGFVFPRNKKTFEKKKDEYGKKDKLSQAISAIKTAIQLAEYGGRKERKKETSHKASLGRCDLCEIIIPWAVEKLASLGSCSRSGRKAQYRYLLQLKVQSEQKIFRIFYSIRRCAVDKRFSLPWQSKG